MELAVLAVEGNHVCGGARVDVSGLVSALQWAAHEHFPDTRQPLRECGEPQYLAPFGKLC